MARGVVLHRLCVFVLLQWIIFDVNADDDLVVPDIAMVDEDTSRTKRQSSVVEPPIGPLQINKISARSFRVAWTPADKHLHGITGQRLTVQEVGHDDVREYTLKAKIKHHVVDQLEPATSYKIKLTSLKRVAESEPLTSIVTTGQDLSSGNVDEVIHDLAEKDHVHDHVDIHDHGEDFIDEGQVVEDCKKVSKVDIVILIDGSWSVGPENFKTMQKFLSSLSEAFTIGISGVQLGLAQYSDDPRVEFWLDQHLSNDEMVDAINQVEYKGGNTATGAAIDFVREELFSVSNGARPDAIRKTAIVITDGESILDSVTEPSERLRESGVVVYSVGVGAAVRNELEDIATDPDIEHLFSVDNYDSIDSIRAKLLKDVCKSISLCPTPAAPHHGNVSCANEEMYEGTICRYTCDGPMYSLEDEVEAAAGVALRTCLSGMLWDKPFPHCKHSECEDLPRDQHGSYDCNDDRHIGSTCTLNCNVGYRPPRGNFQTTCLRSMAWTNNAVGCMMITCRFLTIPAHGDMRCDNGNRYGSRCSFECNEGFDMVGSPQARCGDNGQWSESPPVCQRITCSQMTDLEYGRTKCSNNNMYASRCTFSCNVGYELSGSNAVTCIGDGRWEFSLGSQLPICEQIQCDNIMLTENLLKDCTDGDNHGSTCEFTCEEGYNLIGDDATMCTGNISPGHWTKRTPYCQVAACSELLPPSNSRLVCTDGSLYRSKCKAACDIGYELRGGNSAVCNEEGEWDGGLGVCRIITCGEIDLITHGIVTCSDYDNYGSRCQHKCNVGYKMVSGSKVRVCGRNKQYSGDPPKCIRKSCVALRPPRNGVISCTNGNDYGSVCEQTCNVGYEMVGDLMDGNDVTRVCGDEEEWSGTLVACNLITCPVLVPPQNGGMFCSSGVMFASVCQFRCNKGYQLSGTTEKMCGEKGVWSGGNPSCTLITCSEVPVPPNADVACSTPEYFNEFENDGDEASYGTTCSITCEEGFNRTGSETRVCEEDHSWSGSDTDCIGIICPQLNEPLHGSITCSKHNKFASICTTACDNGYFLSEGDSTRICKETGKWTGDETACQIKTCDNMVAKPHTTLSCTNGNRFGSICSVTAQIGYKLNGISVIECTDTGAEDPPGADEIVCPSIGINQFGMMTCTNSLSYDSTCSFICTEGYDLLGSTTRTCLVDGNWSGTDSSCEVSFCDHLAVPENGFKSCTKDNLYSSTCTFTCEVGFDLAGSAVRRCQTNDVWSGIVVACDMVSCKPMEPPDDGSMDCDNDNIFNSNCMFTCNEGYELKGPKTRRCQADHKWSGADPICKLITCPTLTTPQHGQKSCTFGNQYASECTLTCNMGYDQSGSKKRVCNADHKWSGTTTHCGIVTCADLQQPMHGSKRCSDETNYESKCVFSCTTGYELRGSSSRVCEDTGQWTGSYADCMMIKCPEILAPKFGNIDCSNANNYDSTCDFNCRIGYDLVGSDSITCQLDKMWSSNKPKCQIVRCGAIPTTFHGTVQCGNEDFYNSQCFYECNEGYQMIGDGARVCKADGEWSGNNPTCEQITCAEVDLPPYIHLDCSNGFVYGSTCGVSVDDGFKLVGDTEITCRDPKNWKINTLSADVIQCDELAPPEYGGVKCTDENFWASKCTYSCNIGYELTGSVSRICEGEWTGEAAVCTLIECAELPMPLSGNVLCTEGRKLGSECSFICDEGYDLIGDENIVCEISHDWTSDPPKCIGITCGSISSPNHGSISCSNGDNYNSVCGFKCNEGYRLKGSTSRTCLDSHAWSGDEPSCDMIRCGAMDSPMHGSVSCSAEDAYSSMCSFSCNTGYDLVGQQTRDCEESGQWSGLYPTCDLVQCPKLPKPTNGVVTCTSGADYNSLCRFVCNEGFEMIGSSTRVCQDDGTFSGSETSCDLISCPKLERIDNGSVRCVDRNRYNSVCSYTCQRGFEMIGPTSRKCLASGSWSDMKPICHQIQCGNLVEPEHGSYNCSNKDNFESRCNFQCNNGYQLNGRPSVTCLSTRKWSGLTPLCTLIQCSPRTSPMHGSVSCSLGNAYSSVCTYACNVGYILIGDEPNECMQNKKWSGTNPQCQMIQCGSLLAPNNGLVTCTSKNNYNSVCRFICVEGYELQGISTRVCQEDGTYSGSQPSCKLITCEDIGGITSGSVRCIDGNRYNSVCMYSCNSGYEVVGASSRKCLTSGRWSDTAPSCQRVECRRLRLPGNGALVCTNSNLAGSVCEVQCDSCYRLYGSPERTCRGDGSWTGEEAVCSSTQCDPLRIPVNGYRDCGDSMNECGTTCRLRCAKGFRMIGSDSRTCQADGRWSGKTTECLRETCPPLEVDDEVEVNCTDENRIGSNCTFTCPEDSVLIGSKNRVCLKLGVWSNTSPICRRCKSSVSDIMFIVDGSWSVGEGNFRKAKDFLKALVVPFEVGWDNTRFSVIQYSDDPRVEFYLNDYFKLNEVMSAIDGIPYQGGNTNTGQALKFALYNALSPSNGARPFVTKTAVVITDGRSQDEVGNPARELRQTGMRILAVGVGDADDQQLKEMASPPHEEMIHYVRDYDSISEIQSLLAAKLCETDLPRSDMLCNCPPGPPGPPGLPGISSEGSTTRRSAGTRELNMHEYEPAPTDVVEGIMGQPGPPGLPGLPGPQGVAGPKGDQGDTSRLNSRDKMQLLQTAKNSATKAAHDEVQKVIVDITEQLSKEEPTGGTAARGPPGPPGPQGYQGFKGDRGFNGERGLRGQPGDPGTAGRIGPKGSQGDPGPRGPEGIGTPGPQGPPGRPGKGKRGKAGPRGPRGISGKTYYRKAKAPNMKTAKIN